MAKSTKPIRYTAKTKISKLAEPVVEYRTVNRLPAIADFPSRKFEKIANLVPFTQKEWSNILHLSERTLQRYAKDNKKFEGIYVERILEVEQLIEAGLETFATADALYQWLHRTKMVLGQTLTFESIYSSRGLRDVTDQLKRIQQGVYT